MPLQKHKSPFHLIIIGSGPIGLACAIEAKKAGLKFLILDKGCIVNSIFHYPSNMTFFSTSERLEIGGIPFVSHGVKPTRKEALDYYRRAADHYKLNVHTYEKVNSLKEEANCYIIKTNKGEYLTRFIILSTGFYDTINRMNVPGEELPKVKHYFDEPHPYAYTKTAVIGAGNSGVDTALELYRVGAEVTMIIKYPEVKKSIKYWVKPDIENRIKEGSIKAYFNSVVENITEKDIRIKDLKTGKKSIIPNDFVFAMTGYKPDFALLSDIGLKIKNDCPVFNKKTHETSRKNIYLAGVICSGLETDKLFIENSREHSTIIIKDILKKISK